MKTTDMITDIREFADGMKLHRYPQINCYRMERWARRLELLDGFFCQAWSKCKWNVPHAGACEIHKPPHNECTCKWGELDRLFDEQTQKEGGA